MVISLIKGRKQNEAYKKDEDICNLSLTLQHASMISSLAAMLAMQLLKALQIVYIHG
jgi:hypothetical protein